MKKKTYNENQTWIKIAVLTFVALVICTALFSGLFFLVQRQNDKEIAAVVSDITYTEEQVKTELPRLQKLERKLAVSDEAKGQLYRALTEISYMTGDEMLYNQYYAKAIYYLKNVQNQEDSVYLTNNYIGRLYANGCYRSAETVLRQLGENYVITDFPLEIQASYYLSCADVAEMTKEDANGFLDKADAAIFLLPDEKEQAINQAKLDILRARKCIMENDFQKAEEIMAQYQETDDFGFGENQVYVVCNFRIPYYEIMAKIYLQQQNNELAYTCVDKYLNYCDEYEFCAMKLHLLQYVVEHSTAMSASENEKYVLLEKLVAQENLSTMTDEYGQFLLTDIDTTISELVNQEKTIRRRYGTLIAGIIGAYALLLLYCISKIFLNSVNKDALTQLLNRKKYEDICTFCRNKKIGYCILMLDIDDFKKVNDTYGHDEGDNVIREIAAIMRQYCGRGITAYRYGGEELCMMLLDVPEIRAREIAEEIRQKTEEFSFPANEKVTVSIGIGVSLHGENKFKEADQNLYQAKTHGKNQVV